MKGWLIYDKKSWERNRWFATELVNYLGCRVIIAEELEFGVEKGEPFFKQYGVRLRQPDYAINRCIYPLLAVTMEKAGIRVFNNSKVNRICNSKELTHIMAMDLEIPTMKTTFAKKGFAYDVEFPQVVKSSAGHGGTEVFMAKSFIELRSALDKIEGEQVLMQPVATDVGIDKRVYVMGNKIIAAVKRTAREGFKSNFSLGGRATLCEALPEEVAAIKKIYNYLDPDFIGVDFIYDRGRPVLNEVEDIVGTRMLYDLTNLNPAWMLCDYVNKVMDEL